MKENELKRLVKSLIENQTEFPHIDCKIVLHLDEDGDKASFIRHVAAIANTGRVGRILVGIEDKTWIAKGLASESSFQNADTTQQRMNSMLAGKIDPPLTISYRTCPYDDLTIGVIEIDGSNPPYIISIADDRFGGRKADGGKYFVYKGVAYFRHSTESIAANRQSQIFEILRGRREPIEIAMGLLLITWMIGTFTGISAALITFENWFLALLFGGPIGFVVGLLLNGRLTKGFGKFSNNYFGQILQHAMGAILGTVLGSFTEVWFSSAVSNGHETTRNVVVMGFLGGPMSVIFLGIPIITALLLGLTPYSEISGMFTLVREKLFRHEA